MNLLNMIIISEFRVVNRKGSQRQRLKLVFFADVKIECYFSTDRHNHCEIYVKYYINFAIVYLVIPFIDII